MVVNVKREHQTRRSKKPRYSAEKDPQNIALYLKAETRFANMDPSSSALETLRSRKRQTEQNMRDKMAEAKSPHRAKPTFRVLTEDTDVEQPSSSEPGGPQEPDWSTISYKDQARTFMGPEQHRSSQATAPPPRRLQPATEHPPEAAMAPSSAMVYPVMAQEVGPTLVTDAQPLESLTEEKIYKAALKGAKHGATQASNRMRNIMIAIAILVVIAVAVGVAVVVLATGGSEGPVTEVSIFNTVYETEHTTTIILAGGGFGGPIPSELFHLTALKTLDLSDNKFTGPLPTELAALKNLSTIDVSDNELTGPIPVEFGDMIQLVHLDVHGNEGMSGGIPPSMENLINLSVFWCFGTSLAGSIPPPLCVTNNASPDFRIDCGEIECDCCADSTGVMVCDPVEPTPATTASTSTTVAPPPATTTTAPEPALPSPLTTDKTEYVQGQYVTATFDDPSQLGRYDDVLVFPAEVTDYINTAPTKKTDFGGGAGVGENGRTTLRIDFGETGSFKLVIRKHDSEELLGTSPIFTVLKSGSSFTLMTGDEYSQGQYLQATFSDPSQLHHWDGVLVFPSDTTDYINTPSVKVVQFGAGAGTGKNGRHTLRLNFLETGSFKLVVRIDGTEVILAESLPFTVSRSSANFTLVTGDEYSQGQYLQATFSDPSQLHHWDGVLVFPSDTTDYINTPSVKFVQFGSGAGTGENGRHTLRLDFPETGSFKLVVRIDGTEVILAESLPFTVAQSNAALALNASSYSQGQQIQATFSDPSQLHVWDDVMIFPSDVTSYASATPLASKLFGSGAGSGNNGLVMVDVNWGTTGMFKLVIRVGGTEVVLAESEPFSVT